MHRQREQALVAENMQLRTLLFTMDRTLKTEIRFTEDGEHLGAQRTQAVVLDEAQLKMPFEVIKKSVETSSAELLHQIKSEAVTFKKSLIESTCKEQSEQIFSLERQLG